MCNFRKSDSAVADSSTDLGKTVSPVTPMAATSNANPLMTKNIINYGNDSLSIASVVSGNPPQAQNQSIPKTSPQSNNKISLVPTKLLLKPQTVNSFKSTPTIVYSSVQTSSTSVDGTVTTNAQSSIPMKVVFVNALNSNGTMQQGGKTQQITINNKSLAQLQQTHNSAFLTNKLLSTNQGQKVQIVQSTHLNSVPKVTTTVNNGDSGVKSNKGLLGTKLPGISNNAITWVKNNKTYSLIIVIRNLLTNIVEIENQRLEIEKQRFEYEKTVGNELLSMFRTFIGNQAKSGNHQINENSDKPCE